MVASLSVALSAFATLVSVVSGVAPMVHPMVGVPMMGKMGYPMMMGPKMGYPPMGGSYGQQQQQRRRIPEILTCISKDDDDQTAQIRLTLSTSRRASSMPMTAAMGGFGGFDDDHFDDDFFDDDFDSDDFEGERSSGDYRIDGAIVPGLGLNKEGTYQVVVTQFGRVADGCLAQALGPVLSIDMLNRKPRGGMMGGYGKMGMSPMGMMGGYGMMHKGFGMSPMMGHPMMGGFPAPYQNYGANFWQGNNGRQARRPVGILGNPAIVGASASIYSTHIEGISRSELLGRGVALCKHVHQGQCVGHIPYCCTVQRDSLPAMELFVETDTDDFNGMGGGMGMQGGMGGMDGGNGGLF